MSDDWMADQVKVGDRIADEALSGMQNPVYVGVALGRAAGVAAKRIEALLGKEAAEDFVRSMILIFNQETLRDSSERPLLSLRLSQDIF